MPEKNKIINRLKSLEDIEGVLVKVSDGGNTVRVKHDAFHSLDFVFRWLERNHFVGYFIDAEGNESQAVISLWTGLDAIYFGSAYSLLTGMRAKQKG